MKIDASGIYTERGIYSYAHCLLTKIRRICMTISTFSKPLIDVPNLTEFLIPTAPHYIIEILL